MVLSRREFLKANAVATVGLAAKKHGISPRRSLYDQKTVRVGVVGTGNRGRSLLGILLNLKNVEIPALCDIHKDHLAEAQDMVVKSGRKKPEAYSRDETDCFGINDYFIRRFGPDHPNAKRTYAQGDIVSTVVRTKKGKSIVINYDMQLPRPYDNRWMIQGTRGIYNEQRNAAYLTGVSPEYHFL